MAAVLIGLDQLGALLSVIIIDVVLAGDNAIVVGMAAAGLPAREQRRVIVLGIAAATVLRIVFAYYTTKLLEIIGLTLAGGVLLLWVAWKMFRELRHSSHNKSAATPSGPGMGAAAQGKSAGRALFRIVIADVSMSLDNVLAVAGTARDHFWVLAFGLVLSVALTGAASTVVARLLERYFWISWVGLAIIAFVALRMIWSGSVEVITQTAALAI